jgi:hypothetical protein
MRVKLINGMTVCGVILSLCFFLFTNSREARSAGKENHCFTCHTNARKLIEITREIKKDQTGKPGASQETEGEG